MKELLEDAVAAVTGAIAGRALAHAPELQPVVTGTPVSRIDGVQKVTGEARYSMDVALPGMAHAVLVTSPIARGRITGIDDAEAAALPGVIAIFTHENAPRLRKNLVPQIGAGRWSIGRDFRPLQDDGIRFAGQPVAMVVADTYEQANEAASRLSVSYDVAEAETDMNAALADAFPPALRLGKADYARGDAAAALAAAPVRVEGEFATPPQTNNPLGLFATVAAWDGDHLTLYDANQWTRNVQRSATCVLGRPAGGVAVNAAFVGGGFGAGLRAWPNAWLAALVAREVGRPVKLVLTRAQMFTAVGRRAETVQKVSLGAERDGRLTAIIHDAVHDTSRDEDFVEALGTATRMLYACDNVETQYRTTRLDRSTPTYMRCPGEAETLFALESALDELAYTLDLDPIELRQRNEPEGDPEKGEPWSSRSLATCYTRGAELFGWSRRTPAPGSMRDGDTLIGYGVASATYPAFAMPATAIACLFPDGTALVRSAATDVGPGTATALAQVAADALGLPMARVRVEIGDSGFPMAPQQGGSTIMASVGSAVLSVCADLRREAIALACADPESPLAGLATETVIARDGQLVARDDPARVDTYAAILTRRGRGSLERQAKSMPLAQRLGRSCHAFGAQFVEVHVDAALRTIRVPRMLGVFGVGRVVNPKLTRGQLMGGMIWGLSQALLEETAYDHRLARIGNASLGDYLVPVHADIGQIEVECVPEEDPYVNPLGVKGVGEVGMAGVAPAIANAVYHATGVRVRHLPITIEKLL